MQMEREKKAGVAILISDKIDLKTEAIIRDKEVLQEKLPETQLYLLMQ